MFSGSTVCFRITVHLIKEMSVNPVRICMGRISRIIIHGDLPANERFSSEFSDGIEGNPGAHFIRNIIHRVLNTGVMKGNEIPVAVQMCFPDDLHDPAFRQAGCPAARRGTAPDGQNPGQIEDSDENNCASDVNPGIQGYAADLNIPENLENHAAERQAKKNPDYDRC